MFTRDEAKAFLTAEKLVNKLTDSSTRKSFNDAMFKIKAIIRNSEKDYLEKLEEHIAVVEDSNLPEVAANKLHLQAILSALYSKEIISIGYTDIPGEKFTTRDIEPLEIFYLGRYWYLVAYCTLRNNYRHFRTDRNSFTTKSGNHFDTTHPDLKTFLKK